MGLEGLYSPSFNIMQRGLDAASQRQTVISNNLANNDTPGFKKSVVTFEDELIKALNTNDQIAGFMTNSKHISIGRKSIADVEPKTLIQKDTSLRNDGNNVDIDEEMAKLSMNSIMYNALTQQLSGEFTKLKSVIKEGR